MSTTKARDNDGGSSSDDSNNPAPSAGDSPRRIERIALPPGAIVATWKRRKMLPKSMPSKADLKHGSLDRFTIRLRCVYCGQESDFNTQPHCSAHAADCPNCGSIRACVAPLESWQIDGVHFAKRTDARDAAQKIENDNKDA